jgi:hypothetical protein
MTIIISASCKKQPVSIEKQIMFDSVSNSANVPFNSKEIKMIVDGAIVLVYLKDDSFGYAQYQQLPYTDQNDIVFSLSIFEETVYTVYANDA